MLQEMVAYECEGYLRSKLIGTYLCRAIFGELNDSANYILVYVYMIQQL